MMLRRYAVVVKGVPIKLFWTLGRAERWREKCSEHAYVYHYGQDVERKRWVWYKIERVNHYPVDRFQ